MEYQHHCANTVYCLSIAQCSDVSSTTANLYSFNNQTFTQTVYTILDFLFSEIPVSHCPALDKLKHYIDNSVTIAG